MSLSDGMELRIWKNGHVFVLSVNPCAVLKLFDQYGAQAVVLRKMIFLYLQSA